MTSIASSSKVTLDHPSHLPRRPPSARRKTAAFVLSLCVPYVVTANPLPLPTLDGLPAPIRARGMDRILTIASSSPLGLYALPDGYVRLTQIFQPGFIVLSYCVAVVGSLCTLELLIRRTTNHGWRNQLLLFAAGLCFGGVSTFSMHFIFNNALALDNPSDPTDNVLYLSYAPGFTVLSLVASVVAMTCAFFVMGTRVQDWSCLHRRSRAVEKSKSDEYGTWKSNLLDKQARRKDLSVGGIMAKAGRVAKWSMLEPGRASEERWRSEGRSGRAKGSGGETEEDLIKSDQRLSELEFRMGRTAARNELEKRLEVSMGTVSSASINGDSTARLFGLESQFPKPPPVALPAPPRRGSTPTGLFSPGYSFGQQESYFPSTADIPPTQSAPGRRASLPITPISSAYNHTLSRIQSHPEADSALSPIPGSPSVDEEKSSPLSKSPSSPGFRSPSPSEPSVSRAAPTWNKIERFLGMDVVTRSEILKICMTGTIAGFGVAAMHYIGQASITDIPYIAYRPAFVVGSVIIAASAVQIALYIMFIMLRPKLKHNWIMKIVVAMILAVAVCCMHFTAMMGTIYGWPEMQKITKHDMLSGSNRAITAIVASLAMVACVCCCIFFFIEALQKRRERKRRRRVVVASILLDSANRILVNTTDGLPPMCDIASLTGQTSKSSKRSWTDTLTSAGSTILGMDLTTGHDAFVSALKLSWYWKMSAWDPLNPFGPPKNPDLPYLTGIGVPSMDRRESAVTTGSSVTGTSRPQRVSATRFLERFVISARQLAVRLTGEHVGISRVGVLYDQIVNTGWEQLTKHGDGVSKGQLMLLVRRVNSAEERTDLLTRNFIWADSASVSTTLQRTLSVPSAHLDAHFADLQRFCDSAGAASLKSATLYTGVAVVQATPFDGLRILLDQSNRSHLPMRELCTITASTLSDSLSGSVEELGEATTWLEGMTLWSIIHHNMSSADANIGGPRVRQLLRALERAVVPMLDSMLSGDDMAHILPRLTLNPVLIPLTPGSSRQARGGPTYLLLFYAHYDAAVNTFTDKWLPFSLFSAQNACVMAPRIAAATQSAFSGLPAPSSERRPSRVQFEFPPSGDNTVSSYAFPSRASDEIDLLPSPPPSAMSHSSGGPRGRRSSLKSRPPLPSFDSHPSDRKNSAGGSTSSSPGVAYWDPDWLINLLRTKLRADA